MPHHGAGGTTHKIPMVSRGEKSANAPHMGVLSKFYIGFSVKLFGY